MSITTIAGAQAGLQAPQFFNKNSSANSASGRPQSFWAVGGNPPAGTFNSTLAGGTYSSTSAQVTGQIPHFDPASGNSYLARFSASSSNASQLLICDRLWDNGGITITSTTAQTVNSVTWPSRDATGTTNGVGVFIAVEVSATCGAATPTLTLGYTNSSGTASRTATNIDPTVSAAWVGQFYRIGVQAGDVGVQSVQSITLSASWISGTINLVAYRVLSVLECQANNFPFVIDELTGGFPQLFNGTVPFLINVAAGSGGNNMGGQYIETQG